MAASRNVRRYIRVAERRLEDAEFLHGGGRVRRRQTGAVYLAGYAVECGLKALLLSRSPAGAQPADLYSHSLLSLRDGCERAGVNLNAGDRRRIRRLAHWDTQLRYDLGDTDPSEAAAFLKDAAVLLDSVKRSV